MKKIILAVILLVGISVVSYALVDKCFTKVLSTSYQEVTVTLSSTAKCVPVLVWTSDGTGFYIAQDASGTGARFIPGEDISFSGWGNDCVKVDSDGVIFWAKAVTGTPTLYIDVGRN